MWQAFVTMQSTYHPVPFVSSNSTFPLLGNRIPKLRCPFCHVTVEVGNMIAMLLYRGFWSLSDRCVIVSMLCSLLYYSWLEYKQVEVIPSAVMHSWAYTTYTHCNIWSYFVTLIFRNAKISPVAAFALKIVFFIFNFRPFWQVN